MTTIERCSSEWDAVNAARVAYERAAAETAKFPGSGIGTWEDLQGLESAWRIEQQRHAAYAQAVTTFLDCVHN